jgi:hypothetical protein
VFFEDGGVCLALGFAACRRQTGKIWRSIVTVAVKEHCAAKNNGRTLRARPEQHRHDATEEIVGDDDVGWEIPKDLQEELPLKPRGAGNLIRKEC